MQSVVDNELQRKPSVSMLVSEPARAAAEWAAGMASAAWLATAPRGSGQPVLLLPCLFVTDAYTATTRTYLRSMGFDARPWHGGRNWGDWDALHRVVVPAVRRLHAETGRRVGLVGASMGGLYAREAARHLPQMVRCVVTLASAVSGPHRANHI